MILSGKIIIPFSLLLTLVLCKKNSASGKEGLLFDTIPESHLLQPLIREVSGIADSHLHPGFLWAQEDSGNPPQIYLIDHNGVVSKKVYLHGITNRDWEDMCISNGMIYLAETGDNNAVYTSSKFYRFPEPATGVDTIYNIETISFTYPDHPHDAEAFLTDYTTGDIYIITKRDIPSKIFRLTPSTGSTTAVVAAGELPFSGVVSAAISKDGKEILIKTYTSVYSFPRKNDESISDALHHPPKKIGYIPEPQGEAICFADDNSGFFTLSEQSWSTSVNLNFYHRK